MEPVMSLIYRATKLAGTVAAVLVAARYLQLQQQPRHKSIWGLTLADLVGRSKRRF
jgi:hypothetical protein